GIVDRFYFSTDILILERDTGVAWAEVARGETAIRLVQLAERLHTSLTGITPDQHHTAFTPADHTAIGDGAPHHARYTDAEALAAAKAGAGVLEGDLVQLDAVGLPAVDGSQLTGLPAGYTDEEAQATVKANVEVGDLKAPTKALDMNGEDITGVGSITASELHGTTYWGDVYFEDVECPICHLKFKKGDKIMLMVNVVEEKYISAFPVHLKCNES
ncbi:unnamed protein product, partial [marine sediment metagenome]